MLVLHGRVVKVHSGLQADDEAGETVKHPHSGDVKKTELVVHVVYRARIFYLRSESDWSCVLLVLGQHVQEIALGIKTTAPVSDLTGNGIFQVVGSAHLKVNVGRPHCSLGQVLCSDKVLHSVQDVVQVGKLVFGYVDVRNEQKIVGVTLALQKSLVDLEMCVVQWHNID